MRSKYISLIALALSGPANLLPLLRKNLDQGQTEKSKLHLCFALIIASSFGIISCRAADLAHTNDMADAMKQAGQVRYINLNMNVPEVPGDILMSDQPGLYLVAVPFGGGSSFTNYPLPDVKSFGLQVWLLKTNGTVVPQRGQPGTVGIGNAGWDTYSMIYTFDKVPSNELAGLVVQVKGKLYCQKITVDMIGPAHTPMDAVCGRWQSEAGESYQFDSDGTYEHWQQVPPVSKLAQAEDVDGSARKNVTKGRFTIDHDWLVFTGNDGVPIKTNSYYVIADRVPNDKGKFFQNDLSLVIRQPDKGEKTYELMYR